MTVRVIHDGDWIHPGGGARVAKELARALDAPLTVGHSATPEFWLEDDVDVEFAFQDEFQGRRKALYNRVRGLAELRLAQRFRSLDYSEDLLVTSGTAAKWIIPQYDQHHVHYCHTPPPRFYGEPRKSLPGWAVSLAGGLADRHFSSYVDQFLANSEFTRTRVQKHYREDATVLHPPVRTDAFRWQEPNQDRYLVMIGRLNEMKRADVVAEAWRDIDDVNLVMIGNGPLRAECEAVDGVSVYSDLMDYAVEWTVARSVGGIALAELEHCGITPKEIQAAGKPVLVPDEPNLRNHATDSETGIIVPPSPEAVRDGVQKLVATEWNRETIEDAAETWSTDRFHRKARRLILEGPTAEETRKEKQENPGITVPDGGDTDD